MIVKKTGIINIKKSLRERSPLVYVLVALIPYSKPNLLLAYKPSVFFRELEKISRHKQSTLRSAYRRAEQQKLIEQKDSLVKLTETGRRKIAPFVAKKLKGQVYLMVIFDIPEDKIDTRRVFRSILKEMQFRQVQKSVWITGKDLMVEVENVVKEMKLVEYVQIYECHRHFPKE